MDVQNKPEFGSMQPSNGIASTLKFRVMGRPRKPVSHGNPNVLIVRQNIERRMAEIWRTESTITKRLDRLQRASGVGAETVRRFLAGGGSIGLDNLISIAEAMGISMPDLFTDAEAKSSNGSEIGRIARELHRKTV